jgi:hypothetical protein
MSQPFGCGILKNCIIDIPVEDVLYTSRTIVIRVRALGSATLLLLSFWERRIVGDAGEGAEHVFQLAESVCS